MKQSNIIYKIRFFLYVSLAYFFRRFLKSYEKNQIFILCYHSISSDQWKYGVSLATIKRQLNYLTKIYNPITLNDVEDVIYRRKKISHPSFAVTFDDGYKEVLLLKSFLKKKNIKPTFFILSGNQPNYTELDTRRPFLSKSEIKSLIVQGWMLGSHSATHSDFWHLSSKQINQEINESKSVLEQTYKQQVTYFAYPKGRYTKSVLRATRKAGYTLGLSMDDGFINEQTNSLVVPRIGVDRSHTFKEFTLLMLPSSIMLRFLIKKIMSIWFQKSLI